MPNMTIYINRELQELVLKEVKDRNLEGPSKIFQGLLEAHYKKVKR